MDEVVCLSLHGTNTTVLRYASQEAWDEEEDDDAYSEHNPLHFLAIFMWRLNGVKGKLVFLVEMLGKVEEYSRSLEDVEAVVGDGGYSTVGIDLQRKESEMFV
jgi:hypothetical protein